MFSDENDIAKLVFDIKKIVPIDCGTGFADHS